MSSMLTTWNMSNTVGHGCAVWSTTVYLSFALKVGSCPKKPVIIPTVTFGLSARCKKVAVAQSFSVQTAGGPLIVGKLSGDGSVREKMKRLAGDDIRVETFRDLLNTAETVYGEVEKRLKKIAPEYARESRKSRKKG